jgi:predicted flap endonuclease-1-like 5' DNA nuclease
MGHRTKHAIEMDGLRTRRLKEAYELANIYRFTFKQLATWTDQEIATEMNL